MSLSLMPALCSALVIATGVFGIGRAGIGVLLSG